MIRTLAHRGEVITMTSNHAAGATGSSRHHRPIYKPEDRRDLAFTVYEETPVPAHWCGWVPDPNAQRRTVSFGGDAPVAGGLLRGGFSNLSVLIWAKISSWFYEQDCRFSDHDLAQALFCPPISMAHLAAIRAALQPLIGNWIQCRRDRHGALYYIDYCQAHGETNALLRGEQFAELLVEGRTRDSTISHADLVNFARWRRECTYGWTIESTRRLAEAWHMPHTAVSASRKRLADLGWLIVLPRQDQANDDSCLVWISELYDPDLEMVELHGSPPRRAKSYLGSMTERISLWHGLGSEAIAADQMRHHLRANSAPGTLTISFDQLTRQTAPATRTPSTSRRETAPSSPPEGFDVDPATAEAADDIDRPDISVRRTERHAHHPPATTARPRLTELRLARARRRRGALLTLTSPQHGWDGQITMGLRTHEVYLIHFPEESCFKVGLTHSMSHRINLFSRHGGIVVERVTVDNKFLAEIIEVDVLDLTEAWHQLGDRERPGRGYTEMWSDDGPTVDLERVKLQASQLVARLRDLMNGTPQ